MVYGGVVVFVRLYLSFDDGAAFPFIVCGWVRPKVLPEGLYHIRHGGLDSVAEKGRFVC